MDEKRQVTPEEFIQISKLESLANQNAQQALRISDLEAQVKLLSIQLNNQNQGEESPIEAEAVDEEDVDLMESAQALN